MPPSPFISRRSFMRAAGTAAAVMPVIGQGSRVWAAPAREVSRDDGSGDARYSDPSAVIISSNENPLGPCAAALAAIVSSARDGWRYHHETKKEVVEAFRKQFGLKDGYVSLWPGSGPPLGLALKSHLGPDKALVCAEPSYEQGPRAAQAMNAKIFAVPLTADGAHDVRKMAAATANPGVYYIVNPNNPTGTMTRRDDILWLLKNKAPGSVVIVDEAYHHFSKDQSLIDQVAADQDIIVTRTFSKIYGMAGLRAGFLIARPELQARLAVLGPGVSTNGASDVSMTTARAALASLLDKDLIPQRRKINADIRDDTLAWLDRKGVKIYRGSQANFFMVDVKRSGRDFAALMQEQKVYIGRSWPSMPTWVRVTVGTAEEMRRFQAAFQKAYETPPALTHRDLPYTAPCELEHLYA